MPGKDVSDDARQIHYDHYREVDHSVYFISGTIAVTALHGAIDGHSQQAQNEYERYHLADRLLPTVFVTPCYYDVCRPFSGIYHYCQVKQTVL